MQYKLDDLSRVIITKDKSTDKCKYCHHSRQNVMFVGEIPFCLHPNYKDDLVCPKENEKYGPVIFIEE